MLDFPKTVTIEGCEKFLTKLVKLDNVTSLVLPVDTSSYAFGGLASAIQAVNTWVRLGEDRVLELRNSIRKDVIEELANKPHKFVAAMSAKMIAISGSPANDLRPQVNLAAKNAIEQQAVSPFGQQRGGLCWFSFVDHSSKGFDQNFYIQTSGFKAEPRQSAQIKAIITEMVKKSLAVTGGAKLLTSQSQDSLGRLFNELFLNTHEHGTRGQSRSEWLKPGVRTIYTQGIRLTEDGVQGIVGDQPRLSAYLQSITQQYDTEGQRRFVEIGIVDSGLGYCGRWLADNQDEKADKIFSLADEFSVFKRCFTFRETSTYKDNKGNGLPVVMDRLTQLHGFMRIRSGRLSLYRDFVESPYKHGETCEFSDWTTGQFGDELLTPMSKVAGVAITLLIPVEAKQ